MLQENNESDYHFETDATNTHYYHCVFVRINHRSPMLAQDSYQNLDYRYEEIRSAGPPRGEYGKKSGARNERRTSMILSRNDEGVSK